MVYVEHAGAGDLNSRVRGIAMILDHDSGVLAIMDGDLDTLRGWLNQYENFPNGRDDFVERAWLEHAIDLGSLAVIEWLLQNGADANYESDEGFPALHAVMDREEADRDDVIRLLLKHGVDVNQRGSNDWTPLHRAAFQGTISIMEILIAGGADLQAKTRIDNYATPLEEARALGVQVSVEFLEKIMR